MVSWGEEVANHASDFAVASSVVEQVEEDSHEMNSDVKSCGKSSLPCRFRLDLIPFAQNCCSPADYDLLKEHILDPSLNGPNMHFSPNNNEEFSFQSDESNISDDGELRTTLLHATLQSKGNKRLPLDIIQCIVDMSGVDMVTYQDENGATPLHLAISELPRRIDIIQYLLRKAPENVLKENDLHLRPIDLMSHKIIMGEEGVRYDGENYTQDHELGPMWEAVDCLVKASTDPNNYDTLDTPLLHSCLTSNDFPFALMQRAIERYADQLEIPDENGDLPLHLVVSRPPGDTENFDDAGDIFSFMVKKYPDAATFSNQRGLSPLAVAIENGHGWQSKVVRNCLMVVPKSIGTLPVPPNVMPYLLERLVGSHTVVFELLRARPHA